MKEYKIGFSLKGLAAFFNYNAAKYFLDDCPASERVFIDQQQ